MSALETVPTDDVLLDEIQSLQGIHGSELGIQKIWDLIKAEHPEWSFGLKRLREIRKKNNLAPTPPRNSSLPAGQIILELKMVLPDILGGGAWEYDEPFPAHLCTPTSDPKDAQPLLAKIIGEREFDLRAKYKWKCLFCPKKATACYGCQSGALTRTPPLVVNAMYPVCSMKSLCGTFALTEAKRRMNEVHVPSK
ncbi:hypothetical protein DXG03_005158 [Asterophora parasitica]|uniref:Uncharacterized protein n=1 Tax=Asterophora parasitica TaxID=117018 RepID=A0A9P7GEQ1_9AGAR|nr:hypothetical protein DXG03_005158 [Asterophora parasitica]